MKSEIRSIKIICKHGAYGNPNAVGFWTYGRRPDGRYVPCKTEVRRDGSVIIISHWRSPSCSEHEIEECATEFSAAEWGLLEKTPEKRQPSECDRILEERARGQS